MARYVVARRAFYNRCSTAELRAFVKARTGRSSVDAKARLVVILLELDHLITPLLATLPLKLPKSYTTFRLMDLPPELRNIVYENVKDNPTPRRWSDRSRSRRLHDAYALMLASKTLCHEYRPFLYEGETIMTTCSLETKTSAATGSRAVCVHLKGNISGTIKLDDGSNVSESFTSAVGSFRKRRIQHLEIKLLYQTPDRARVWCTCLKEVIRAVFNCCTGLKELIIVRTNDIRLDQILVQALEVLLEAPNSVKVFIRANYLGTNQRLCSKEDISKALGLVKKR